MTKPDPRYLDLTKLPLQPQRCSYVLSAILAQHTRFGQPAIDKAVRFYLVPGYSHFGGLSFNATQGLSAFSNLEDWVERGVVPGTLTATDTNAGKGNRTRPLCVYPAWPKYSGAGDVNSAASFACVGE